MKALNILIFSVLCLFNDLNVMGSPTGRSSVQAGDAQSPGRSPSPVRRTGHATRNRNKGPALNDLKKALQDMNLNNPQGGRGDQQNRISRQNLIQGNSSPSSVDSGEVTSRLRAPSPQRAPTGRQPPGPPRRTLVHKRPQIHVAPDLEAVFDPLHRGLGRRAPTTLTNPRGPAGSFQGSNSPRSIPSSPRGFDEPQEKGGLPLAAYPAPIRTKPASGLDQPGPQPNTLNAPNHHIQPRPFNPAHPILGLVQTPRGQPSTEGKFEQVKQRGRNMNQEFERIHQERVARGEVPS